MELIKFIQSFASPFWDSFFIQVTWLGEGHFFMILFALCLWCVNKEFGYRMGFAFFERYLEFSPEKYVSSPAAFWTNGYSHS